ncbi:FecR family protein [Maribellus luteus]|uniref:FecR family protein n=1 Tax=Maribellus luteus TaxID=2305463 RepID=A0A399SN28_9BACT|nr:FecR domain-containing protein [Maribellus luteus]RIJ45406.1 FecR family protein [Maribellus luteus]
MISKTDIDKLQRFSRGISNAEEEKYVYTLFAENEKSREFKKYLQQEFNEYLISNPEENHNLSYLLDRIHHRINKRNSQKRDTVVRKIYRWYSVGAAILLLPVLLAGILWFTVYNKEEVTIQEASVTSTLLAPLGSRISFFLPDGTQGWLNSGSSLEYSLPFSNNRQITVNGEAWFDVAHDKEHPFEVTLGDSKVKVLGTKFNLSAYPEEKYLEVVLEEGKVEFITPGLSSGIVMNPNERLVLNEGAININVTNTSKYSSWRDGKLVFRGDSMDEVARRIARWYNVDVDVADEELNKYTFRGMFQDDSLEEVVHYISMTSPIDYRIVERKQLDDGTIQKKKVVLYQKNME